MKTKHSSTGHLKSPMSLAKEIDFTPSGVYSRSWKAWQAQREGHHSLERAHPTSIHQARTGTQQGFFHPTTQDHVWNQLKDFETPGGTPKIKDTSLIISNT